MKNGLLLIDRFYEGHNHELISLKDREFQKLSRNIIDYHKMIIVSNSRLKIGATKTYRICKEHVNGFENIGASLNDFKNFHRDVKCFIHERDGQLFVDHFKEMTETRICFYFDYDLDDDDSLRRAIWADARHRFCMWHIMNKMPSKFGVSRSGYNDFMCKINDIMWDNELEAAEFDAIWEQIIEDHGVGVNDWFADTYAIRGQWVMAHCRDLKMASIMRTTQRSESKNSFFKRTGGFTERGELEVTTVKDSSRKKNFEVAYSPGTRKESCSCTMFERTGILCRHILWIFSASGIKTIPEDYVVNRWMKEYLRLRIFNCNGEGTDNMQVIDEKQIAMSIMWSEVHQAVGLLRGKGVTDVDNFTAVIRAFKETLSPLGEVLNKNQQMEKFLKCTASEVVTILPPKNSKNKGSGKRMLSAKTKAMALARKPKRKCKNCKRMTNHDKRYCPNPFSAHTPLCEGSSDPEEDEGEEEEKLELEQE
ncbi:protein FAR-RED IMPAIRED RESPONSE 1-like [Silene latifolia]|uniref:protein FAR-RED IMPAIRED RESPONSE 1-like n=1 Tax=Silene latifolia TaxID=37657 RepID=UPI003D77DCB5